MKKKLKDICSMIHRGKTPKYVEESNVLVFAQKCNLQTGGIDLNKCLCLDTTNLKKWTTEDYLHKNDIVINSTGTGTLGRVGFFDIDSEKPVVPDTHVTVVRVSDKETYSKWVYYFLKYSQNYLISKGHGSTKQQELATSEIEKIEIPLPSYTYQENGAYYLDSIQSAIDNKKQQLQQLDELVKSKFVEMFGENPVESGKWKVETLGDLCSIGGGYAFKSDKFLEDGIPVLRIGNINAGFFRPTNMVYWENDDKLERYAIYPGDLVMSLTGTAGKEDYGNICVLGDEYPKYYLNQRNAKFTDLKNLNKLYLANLLKLQDMKQKLTGLNHGVRQGNILNKDLENLEIPVPPIELQNTFAEYVQKIDSAKSIIKTQLADLQELLDSKMDEYFGE